MTVAVNIYLTDRTGMSNPIVGAAVGVWNQAGTTMITTAVTDSGGVAALALPENVTYQLRFFKNACIFQNPLYIAVLPTPAINNFDVKGEPFVAPISSDPRMCMASGFFRRPDGGPARFMNIHFIPRFKPVLLEGAAILTERSAVRTDQSGYVQIPLIRFAQYSVTVEGLDDLVGVISVPDAATVNLPDLILPVVKSVVFSPVGPYSLTIGTDKVITPTVTASNGVVLINAGNDDVVWSTSDPTVCGVLPASTTLTLRPLKPGTCTLRATRLDNTIVVIPDVGIQGVPVTITVT